MNTVRKMPVGIQDFEKLRTAFLDVRAGIVKQTLKRFGSQLKSVSTVSKSFAEHFPEMFHESKSVVFQLKRIDVILKSISGILPNFDGLSFWHYRILPKVKIEAFSVKIESFKYFIMSFWHYRKSF